MRFPLPALFALAPLAAGLPLPKAPVRLVIPDVKAADAALTGSFRLALKGEPEPTDPLASAWRKTQVGSKLEDQWAKFAEHLPLTWDELMKLQPRALGLALLDAGNLEAVLVVDTPLASLPFEIPAGTKKSHGGVVYTLVEKGAADAAEDPNRRMGLAWARKGSQVYLATSEHALKLALDEALAGRSAAAPLPGLASLELDLDALRQDRYFRREFLFEPGPETGRLKAALRLENGHLVEVREGSPDTRGDVPTFTAAAAAAGWEPEGTPFWPAFRRGLLEPVPAPADLPVPALRPLPEAQKGAPEDRYAVDFTKPRVRATDAPFEAGDLAAWNTLFSATPVTSWGFWVGRDGVRRMVFPWPQARDQAFLEACRTTTARRAGRATLVKAGDATEVHVGPGLPALAVRRTGAYLWVGPSAAALKDAPVPRPQAGLVRWAALDLDAVRAESARWAKAEGPASPEQVRPYSDRVLGLLGWIPSVQALSVERRRTAQGWTEKVQFTPRKP